MNQLKIHKKIDEIVEAGPPQTQEIVKKKGPGAFLVFTASLLDEHGEVLGYLANTQAIPPRRGRDFEGSEIRVDRKYRQTGPNELQASFTITL